MEKDSISAIANVFLYTFAPNSFKKYRYEKTKALAIAELKSRDVESLEDFNRRPISYLMLTIIRSGFL